MTKQQKIKESYGEFYSEAELIGLSNDGYITLTEERGMFCIWNDILMITHKHDNHRYRPASLKGLEENNGWIKIKGKNDLPKSEGEYWVICKFFRESEFEKRIYPNNKFSDEVNQDWWLKFVTHYQPVIKPDLPLF